MTQHFTSAGLSLVELLVVLAIAGVLATLGGPAFVDTLRDQRLSSANNRMVGALLLARSEAVKRNQQVSVCVPVDSDAAAAAMRCRSSAPYGWENGLVVFVNATGNWQIQSDGDTDDGDCSEDEDCVIAIYRPLGNGVTVTGANDAGPGIDRDIVYLSSGATMKRGRPYLTSCDLRGASKARAVHLSAMGRPVASRVAPGGAALLCS